MISEVLAPFKDPWAGGVGTRQNAYLPATSPWRRAADWMIDIRYLDYVRARSRAFPAGPSRTAAGSCCRYLRTWKTSSSSGGGASPATMGA
jgi:hypothetical protein